MEINAICNEGWLLLLVLCCHSSDWASLTGRFQLCSEDCGGMKHMLHTSARSSVTDLQVRMKAKLHGYLYVFRIDNIKHSVFHLIES